MTTILTIDSETFSINGKNYQRIYLPMRIGANNIGIYGIYDTRLQILGATPYSEITVDGLGFASQELAMISLNSALYSNPAEAASNLALDFIAAPITTVATGVYINDIATMGTGLNKVLNDGDIIEVAFGGLIDRAGGTTTLQFYGFGIQLFAFNVTGWSGTGAFFTKIRIQRINSTTYAYIGEGTAVGNNYYTFQGRGTIASWLSNNSFELSYLNVAAQDLVINSGWIKKI